MRPRGSASVLENRRRQAIHLVRVERLSLNAAARRLSCAPSSVMRWWRAYEAGGAMLAFNLRPVPGRPPGLSTLRRSLLLQQLRRGASAHGYDTEVWSTRRIAEVIAKRFGLGYHRSHVGRIMKQCGWHYDAVQRTWKAKTRYG